MTISIVDFDTLKTGLTNWIGDDVTSANYPDMIGLFETWFNTRARLRQMETSTDLTPVAGVASLPSDYLAWRSLEWQGTTPPVKLQYVHPSLILTASQLTVEGGNPDSFTIENGTITVRPLDSANNTLKLRYWQKLTPLSASATTNWLILAYPHLYLFGSLVEYELFSENDERAPMWKARRDEIFSEVVNLSSQSQGTSSVREDAYF